MFLTPPTHIVIFSAIQFPHKFLSLNREAHFFIHRIISTYKVQASLFCDVQLEESNQVIWQHAWEQQGERHHPEVQPQLQGNNFFHPLDAAGEPTLQIGYGPHTFGESLSTLNQKKKDANFVQYYFDPLAGLGEMHGHPSFFIIYKEMIFKLNGVFFDLN